MSRKPPPPTDQSGSQSRNEYIPSFISKKPFYIDESTTDADYLEHQRLQSAPKDTLDKAKWYERGRKLGPAATKFRKGACENCGAMTHKTKECLSRPRKQGAKWTGRDIQADEVIDNVKLGWDAKRDRWNGYDAREYSAVVEEFQELDAMKKAAKAASKQTSQLENGDSPRPDEDDDTHYTEETDMGRNQSTSTRQLRLREDTAKYLLDLNLESARYDPKTRSMDTSTQSLNNANATSSLAEEGFARASGDAAEFERAQRYAWETQEKDLPGSKKLHLQANPTEGELLRKKQTKEAEEKKAAQRQALLEKYGGAEHLERAPGLKAVQVQENERYVEYDAQGQIKGAEKMVSRSKYAEDVLLNNHTSVWGSWWANFQWGYRCCHSLVKNSYCTGEEGKRAFEHAEKMRLGQLLMPPEEEPEEEEKEEAQQGDAENHDKKRTDRHAVDADEEEEEDVSSERKKTKKKPPLLAASDGTTPAATKKRTLQDFRQGVGVTDEEMDQYKRTRATADDPMAAMLGKDELVR